MKPTYLFKVLNHHARHCAVHVYSGDRQCTCGRDKAIDELTTLLENQQPQPTDELTLEQLRRRLYGHVTTCPQEPSHARA